MSNRAPAIYELRAFWPLYPEDRRKVVARLAITGFVGGESRHKQMAGFLTAYQQESPKFENLPRLGFEGRLMRSHETLELENLEARHIGQLTIWELAIDSKK